MGKSLFQKVWDRHTVRTLPNGQAQLFIGLHLIHEVTSPQAFGMLRDLGLTVRVPSAPSRPSTTSSRPTQRSRPFADALAEAMMVALEKACARVRHPLLRRATPASRASCT